MARDRSWVPALLLALCASAQLASAASLVERTALFTSGTVRTTRESVARSQPQARSHVDGHEEDDAAGTKAAALWVLGLPADQQEEVHLTLVAGGGKVLNALPAEEDLHWLVQADAAAVQRVMDQHPSVTAAAYSASLKVASRLRTLSTDTPASAHQDGGSNSAPRSREGFKGLTQRPAGDQLRIAMVASTPGVTTPQAARELSARLQASLEQALARLGRASASDACMPSVTPRGTSALRIQLCSDDLAVVTSSLSQSPEVTFLDLEAQMRPLDLQAVAKLTSSGDVPLRTGLPAPDLTAKGRAAKPHLFPFWKAGLTGKGQVVGVIDSGIDMDSCYLWDPRNTQYQRGNHTSGKALGNATDGGSDGLVTVYEDMSNRKVVQYTMAIDSTDDLVGHGTHVVSSIIGSQPGTDPATQPDQATGVAPGARVAFYDAADSVNDWLEMDHSASEIVTQFKRVGAGVSSHSWGGSRYSYTDYKCAEWDAMAWRNQDHLAVFAAGNDGDTFDDEYQRLTGSVSSPGTCKNVLTVGAAENYVYKGLGNIPLKMRTSDGTNVELDPKQFFSARQRGGLLVTFSPVEDYSSLLWDSQTMVTANLGGFDSGMRNLGQRVLPLVTITPSDACSRVLTSTWPEHAKQVMVLLQGTSSCGVAEALQNLHKDPRVVGGIYWNTPSNDPPPRMISPAPPDGTPWARIDSVTAKYLTSFLARRGSLNVSWVQPDPRSRVMTVAATENVAGFSSFGSDLAFNASRPDRHTRIKPELVAPGYILAAMSDGAFSGQQDSCRVKTISGTSMATPQVSGAAAIARQYFMDGFYPTGARVPANAFTPSGPLLKAVLIAGTQAMVGVSATDAAPLEPPPNQFEGFGRLDLGTTLPLRSNGTQALKLKVWDRLQFNRSGQSHTFTVEMPRRQANASLSFVMTFFDYPAATNALASSVNDLDIMVAGPAGGAGQLGATRFYPNGMTRPDPVNNVEKIHIPDAGPGKYTVTVTARLINLMASPQPYALVALGGMA